MKCDSFNATSPTKANALISSGRFPG